MTIKESKIIFSDVLSCPEAAALWGFSEDKVKRYCRNGKFLQTEARQTGKYWIITRQGMERLFGKPGSKTDQDLNL